MPPQPRYRQIRDSLAAEIVSGERPPGAYLPAEDALARQWQVARMTARRALVCLEEEGLAVAAAGPGQPRRVAFGQLPVTIHVRRTAGLTVPGEWPTGGADSWQADTERAGRTPTQEIEVVTEAASADLAGRIGVAQGAVLICRRLRRFADGAPDNLVWFWYPVTVARGTPLEDPADITEGAVAWLERTRGPLTHEALIELHLAATALAEEAARKLALPPGPVLVVWRVSRDRNGRPVVASRAVYPPRTALRIEGP